MINDSETADILGFAFEADEARDREDKAKDQRITALVDNLARIQQELDRTYKLLEDLTPGGSEFHNDPDRCVEHIRSRFQSEGKLREMVGRMRPVVDAAILYKHHTWCDERIHLMQVIDEYEGK